MNRKKRKVTGNNVAVDSQRAISTRDLTMNPTIETPALRIIGGVSAKYESKTGMDPIGRDLIVEDADDSITTKGRESVPERRWNVRSTEKKTLRGRKQLSRLSYSLGFNLIVVVQKKICFKTSVIFKINIFFL